MSEDYYGFAEQPFSLTPDPRFFFRSESHRRAIDDLRRAIDRREGFMLLTGDIGAGKTTLSRALLDELDSKTFTALVLNPFLTEEELLRVALLDFGVVSREEIRRGSLVGSTKQDLVEVLNQFLLSLSSIGASAVLVIDEAQNLPPATLEQIRVLTNLETDRQKLLQILLVGQLNLLAILGAPGMRQLDQRISRRCQLQPLSRTETESYIAHRLSVARADQTVAFASKALDLVQQLTSGVPRVINLLCDRALECGQAAEATTITASVVRAAAQQLTLEPPRRRRSDRRRAQLRRLAPRLAAAAAITAGILVGAWQVVRYYDVPIWPAPSPLTAGVSAGTRLAPPASEYSILVGSFPTRTAGTIVSERLHEQGYGALELVRAEGHDGYRLLVGPYTDITQAREDAARLQREPGLSIVTIVTE